MTSKEFRDPDINELLRVARPPTASEIETFCYLCERVSEELDPDADDPPLNLSNKLLDSFRNVCWPIGFRSPRSCPVWSNGDQFGNIDADEPEPRDIQLCVMGYAPYTGNYNFLLCDYRYDFDESGEWFEQKGDPYCDFRDVVNKVRQCLRDWIHFVRSPQYKPTIIAAGKTDKASMEAIKEKVRQIINKDGPPRMPDFPEELSRQIVEGYNHCRQELESVGYFTWEQILDLPDILGFDASQMTLPEMIATAKAILADKERDAKIAADRERLAQQIQHKVTNGGRFENLSKLPPTPHSIKLTSSPTETATKTAAKTKEEYNLDARAYLKDHPQAGPRELLRMLKCGTKTLYSLPAFKAVNDERKKGRKPKIVSLTKEMEDIATKTDGELARLIREQRRDQRSDRVRSRERD